MSKKVVYVVGTRPEIIRSAFIINKLSSDREVIFKLLHTGQHYSYLMDKVFFDELHVPAPDINLEVGSGNHIEQISQIMLKSEIFFTQFNPDIVVVFGDTNSSLATALTAVKLNIPLCHVEAGGREWEMDLPEEINRRIIDHVANLLLACSDSHVKNLKRENAPGIIYNTGDPQYEVFNYFYTQSKKDTRLNKWGLKKGQYILLTLHRNVNVDNKNVLLSILNTLNKTLPVLFPIHPRTKKELKSIYHDYDKRFSNILFIEPLSYTQLLQVLSNAQLVITDSGGLQKEAFWTKTACITLRKHTGWDETVYLGVNFLVNPESNNLNNVVNEVLSGKAKVDKKFKQIKNPYFKKNTTTNIVKLIKRHAGHYWH